MIRNNFPVSPGIQMERSLWILILIMHHRAPMRSLVITNVGTHGNYASELQCGPIFNEDGEASCFTFEQMFQSLIWINPRYSLCIINHSYDILPSQVPFKDEHGNNFCTKINLLDNYTSEEMRKEYELRTHVMKWIY